MFLFHPHWGLWLLALALGLMLFGCGIQCVALMVLIRKAPIGSILYALMLLIAGGFLVIDPFFGIVELLLILGISFVFHAFELFVAAARAQKLPGTFRGLAAANGVLSLLFGLLIAAFPVAGAYWINYVFSFFLIFYGAVTLVVGLRLRALRQLV